MPLRRALRRRNALHDRFQHIRHALPGLRADQQRIGRVEPHRALDHLFGARDVGTLQVDLVDDRNNFEPMIDRQIRVRQRLRFHALRSIHHQQRPFASGERARNFVRKIHVPRSVDQIELINLPILRRIQHADGMGLDRDAALALQVHRIEHLLLHFAHGKRPGQLQQPVGQRGFPVINMRNNRKIADVSCIHEDRSILAGVSGHLGRDEGGPVLKLHLLDRLGRGISQSAPGAIQWQISCRGNLRPINRSNRRPWILECCTHGIDGNHRLRGSSAVRHDRKHGSMRRHWLFSAPASFSRLSR